eukprot:CAMPEP_0170540474 /NCGR_PEP_ID=MMETSP0211-20121228/471_1 /TAXON_ID=311385 /ORGANISM="Pseudokeronopsis sp., Strain OXSARD2" /LENGTH=84 /DNA_ID=CAMNT_0010842903 /DNA_START=397 /DNA_END=651 /DNA_ORIENTATION=-
MTQLFLHLGYAFSEPLCLAQVDYHLRICLPLLGLLFTASLQFLEALLEVVERALDVRVLGGVVHADGSVLAGAEAAVGAALNDL